ncbi:MAG: LuxR C-terminal-related transcriptional regulator [Woeseiaceae bacterium]
MRTKLHRPPLPRDAVFRQRLCERLDQGLSIPLTLISAPAGFGKSLLLSQWLESRESPYCWLSLDETDSSLLGFLQYLTATIDSEFPGACQTTQNLLNAQFDVSTTVFGDSLANDLAAVDSRFVLVLDDFHKISCSEVYELLVNLLDRAPACLHVIVATRRDPPFPLNKWRAEGRVDDCRLADLSFDLAETREFIQAADNVSPSQHAVCNLNEVTEGWPAGLRLAILAGRQQSDADDFMARLAGDLRSIQEYLFEEVLSAQPYYVRGWLQRVSILDRFCTPLCETVRSSGDKSEDSDMSAAEFIKFLQESDLPLIALDDDHKWFRLHHLFREMLRHQLGLDDDAGKIALLHGKASDWLERHQFIDEAISHAVAAGDTMKVSKLVLDNADDRLLKEDITTLERWLRLMPLNSVEQDPTLLVLAAYIHNYRGRPAKWHAALERAATLAADIPDEDESRKVYACINAMRSSYLYYKSDLVQALDCARNAARHLPTYLSRLQVHAVLVEAVSLHQLGEHDKALSILRAALKRTELQGPQTKGMVLAGLSAISWMAGDLSATRSYAEQHNVITASQNVAVHKQWSMLYLAIPGYFTNDLTEVEKRLGTAPDIPLYLHTASLMDRSAIIAHTHQARGRHEAATNIADAVIAAGLQIRADDLVRFGRALRAELAVRQGRIQEAADWATTFNATPSVLTFAVWAPELALIRVLQELNTETTRKRALDLLTELENSARDKHQYLILNPVLAFKAVCQHQRGEISSALAALGEAVSLARPSHGLRYFLDVGPRIVPLLEQLAVPDDDVAFIHEVLVTFELETAATIATTPDDPEARIVAAKTLPAGCDLTNREIEVVEKLSQRLRNKEIASQLHVSDETVKYHLRNIYSKLGANSRREAVARAIKSGVLIRQ